jgi:hypothetical protein
MTHVLDALLLFLGLIVALWIAVFGVLGLILSDLAGVPRSLGVLLCIAFGPFGAAWLIWRSRRGNQQGSKLPSGTDTSRDSGSGALL